MYASAAQLQLHHIQQHSMTNGGVAGGSRDTIKCHSCPLSFASAQLHEQHVRTVHARRPHTRMAFHCDTCPLRFATRAHLDKHRTSTHSKLVDVFNNNSPNDAPIAAKVESEDEPVDTTYAHRFVEIKPKPTVAKQAVDANAPAMAHACRNCSKSFGSLAALQGHSHVHMTPVSRPRTCRHVCAGAQSPLSPLREIVHNRRQTAQSPATASRRFTILLSHLWQELFQVGVSCVGTWSMCPTHLQKGQLESASEDASETTPRRQSAHHDTH